MLLIFIAFLSLWKLNEAYYPVQVATNIYFATKSTNNFQRCSSPSHDVFGIEFRNAVESSSTKDDISERRTEERQQKLMITKEIAMTNYQKMRSTLLSDSILVSIIGFSMVWYFGTFK